MGFDFTKMAPKIKVQSFFFYWRPCFYFVLFGQVRGDLGKFNNGASLLNFLDHRAAFRLQVDPLVVTYRRLSTNGWRNKKYYSCCVTSCSSLCNYEKRYCCIVVIRCCRCTVHNAVHRSQGCQVDPFGAKFQKLGPK